MIQSTSIFCFASSKISNCTQNQKFNIQQLQSIAIEIVPLRFIMLLMLLNIKKLVKFTCANYRHGYKILPETNSVQQSRLLGANYEIEPVFVRRHFFSIFAQLIFFIFIYSDIWKKFYTDGQTQRYIQNPVEHLRWIFFENY